MGHQGRGWERAGLEHRLTEENASLAGVGARTGRQFTRACSLVVQDVGDILSLKILHL